MTSPSIAGINLASEPFRRERAQNAGLAAICLLLVCSLVVLISLFLHERRQAAGLRREIRAEQAQLDQLRRQQAQFTVVLGKRENADVFAVSTFLNELIARRAVSWTRIFQDLATVMPANMRLLAIRLPQVPAEEVSGANRVQLDMAVGAERPDAVIELLKRLARSPLFGDASVVNQQAPTQNDPLYKYRLTVRYAQKL